MTYLDEYMDGLLSDKFQILKFLAFDEASYDLSTRQILLG
jgi:hypothetical protein